MEFRKNLANILREKNISQAQLAKACNIKPTTICAWLRGHIPLSNTIKELALYFDVSADYLLGIKDIPYTDEKREITAEEKQLLNNFTQASEGIKEAINKLLNINKQGDNTLNNITEYEKKVAAKICPQCGAKLEFHKNYKNSDKFLGCCNYPNCNFTIKYKTHVELYKKIHNITD